MSDQQLLFILDKKFSGCLFQEIIFNENGGMICTFFDNGGNKHKQQLNRDGTFTTLEL